MSARKKAAKKAARKKAAKKKPTARKGAKKKAAKKKPARKTGAMRAGVRPASAGPHPFAALTGSADTYWKFDGALRDVLFSPYDAIAIVRFNDAGALNETALNNELVTAVFFVNQGIEDRTLTLSCWPFEAAETTIVVPANSAVGPFKVNPGHTCKGTITCSGDPPFGAGGGPGDPQLDGGY